MKNEVIINLKLRQNFYETTNVKSDLVISCLQEIFFCLVPCGFGLRVKWSPHATLPLPLPLISPLSLHLSGPLSLAATSLISPSFHSLLSLSLSVSNSIFPLHHHPRNSLLLYKTTTKPYITIATLVSPLTTISLAVCHHHEHGPMTKTSNPIVAYATVHYCPQMESG